MKKVMVFNKAFSRNKNSSALFEVIEEEFRENEEISETELLSVDAVFIRGTDIDYEKAAKLCGDCRKLEIPVIFDPELDESSDPKAADKLAENCEVFVPSLDDAKKLCKIEDPVRIAEIYLKKGAKKVVVTMNKQGAYFESAVEKGTAPTFRADKVIDETGAGEAFAAGLISGIIDKLPLSEAVIRANACGAVSIQHEGLYIPPADVLRDYMLSHGFVVEGCKDY